MIICQKKIFDLNDQNKIRFKTFSNVKEDLNPSLYISFFSSY